MTLRQETQPRKGLNPYRALVSFAVLPPAAPVVIEIAALRAKLNAIGIHICNSGYIRFKTIKYGFSKIKTGSATTHKKTEK
jgi:hypothetical protein